MPITLGNDFDTAVLTAAGINPNTAQPGTVTIDALPATGNVTIRYTAVATATAEDIRALIRDTTQVSDTPGDTNNPTP